MAVSVLLPLCMLASSAVSAFVPYSPTVRAQITDARMMRLSELLPSTSPKSTASTAIPPIPNVETFDAMPENLPGPLLNTYYFLRHGLSTANVDSIISSNRTALAYTEMHGLTETGYDQGVAAASQLLELISDSDNPSVVFVSSPFARARQTASACLEGLHQQRETSSSSFNVEDTIYLHPNLMERSFGRLDGQAIETYAYVWPLDAFNVTHTAFDVESVAAVCHRFRQCIVELEETFRDQHVVLVSHADVLQIAQLYAAAAENVGAFSSFRFKSM